MGDDESWCWQWELFFPYCWSFDELHLDCFEGCDWWAAAGSAGKCLEELVGWSDRTWFIEVLVVTSETSRRLPNCFNNSIPTQKPRSLQAVLPIRWWEIIQKRHVILEAKYIYRKRFMKTNHKQNDWGECLHCTSAKLNWKIEGFQWTNWPAMQLNV